MSWRPALPYGPRWSRSVPGGRRLRSPGGGRACFAETVGCGAPGFSLVGRASATRGQGPRALGDAARPAARCAPGRASSRQCRPARFADLQQRRAEAVPPHLRAPGPRLSSSNGGGTGSLETTAGRQSRSPSWRQGSGLVGPTLFRRLSEIPPKARSAVRASVVVRAPRSRGGLPLFSGGLRRVGDRDGRTGCRRRFRPAGAAG